MNRTSLTYLSAIALSGLLAQSASAASASWTFVGDGSWVTDSNWSTGLAPGSTSDTNSADIATFGTTAAARAITVDANRNIFGITFNGNSSAYNLSGGSILLTNGGTIQTFGAGSVHTDSISSAIVLQGDGGSQAFTAGSTTNGRILSISGAISGVSTAGNVTTLALNGGNTSSGNSLSGIISDGSGGGQVAVVKSGNSFWTLNGVNTFTGGVTLSGGNLRIGNAAALGSGTFTITGGALSGGGGTITIANNMVWGGAVTYNNANGNSGNLVMSGNALLTATRDVTTSASAASLTVNGVISDGGNGFGLVKSGSYALVLGGANTYTGTTSVNQGTLSFGPAGSLSANSTLAVNAGSTTGTPGGRVNLNGRNITVAALQGTTGSGGLGIVANTSSTNSVLTVNGSGDSTYNGLLVDSGAAGTLGLVKNGTGTVTLTASHNYTGGTTITNGTLLVNGGLSSGAAYSGTQGVVAGAANGVFLMTGLDPTVVSGLVVGQRITGTNFPAGAYITSIVNSTSVTFSSYLTSGNTIAQAESTSAYVGSGLGTGAVTVGVNGTLGGTGVISPSGANGITVNGVLAPGASIGTLTIDLASTTGTVSMAGTGAFKFELGTANVSIGSIAPLSSDLLVLSGVTAGDFTFSGNNVDFLGTGEAGYYKLFDTSLDSSTWIGLTFDSITGVVTEGLTASNLGSGLTGNFIVGTASNGGALGDIYVQVVPEPSTTALVFGAGVSVLLFRRKRQA